MGFLNKILGKKDETVASTPQTAVTPAQPAAAESSTPAGLNLGKVDLGKKTGKISLAKDASVTIANSDVIVARCTWPSKTDYDIYALVLMKDGSVKVVSTFGSDAQPNPTPSILNGAVKHMGDVGRDAVGIGEETIEIRFTPEIEAVVPVVYSAQSNGEGSFKQYRVSCGISNGKGDEVSIEASVANSNRNVYTVAVGIIRNTSDGVKVEALEAYSKPHNENRPDFVKGELVMNVGSRNKRK